MTSLDCFNCCRTLKVGTKSYAYYSLPVAEKNGLKGISRLPFSMKVLLENLLRNEDGRTVTKEDILAVAAWLKTKSSDREIAFRPARVLMQDFTGVPAVVDLAAMRDAMTLLGGDPQEDQPAGAGRSGDRSLGDREFLRQQFRVQEERRRGIQAEPGALQIPEMGAEGVRQFPRGAARHRHLPSGQSRISLADGLDRQGQGEGRRQGEVTAEIAYPDTLVGTDSHTTMVNGMAVLGWGVGGIEAEAAMLGQPLSMLLPEVIGFKLTGKLKEGVTATDLVLTVVEMLRKRGVVGKFVEFFGPGVLDLSIADRATIGNMAPEYGATCGFFPVDEQTVKYLRDTSRKDDRVKLVAAYAKAQGMYLTTTTKDPVFTDMLKLDLGKVEPSLAGPKRPQDRVLLKAVKTEFAAAMDKEFKKAPMLDKRVPGRGPQARSRQRRRGDRRHHLLHQHLQSERDDRRRPAGAQGGGQGPDLKALGEDLACAGLAGGRRISRQVRPAEGSRQARLQSRRLWLHHLHRQFRSAAGGNFQDHQRQRSGRRRGAVGQPQFRRPRECGCARELSRVAAAGGRLRARGLDAGRSRSRRRSAPTSRARRCS